MLNIYSPSYVSAVRTEGTAAKEQEDIFLLGARRIKNGAHILAREEECRGVMYPSWASSGSLCELRPAEEGAYRGQETGNGGAMASRRPGA